MNEQSGWEPSESSNVADRAGRCVWCNDESDDLLSVAWDGSGFYPDKELLVCSEAHRAAVEQIMKFSKRHYRLYIALVWLGIPVYLVGIYCYPAYRPHLSVLIALDMFLCFYLLPFPPPFLISRVGLQNGILLLRLLSIMVIAIGWYIFMSGVV